MLDPLAISAIALIACAAFAAGLFALARQHQEIATQGSLVWARALMLAPAGWLLLEAVSAGGPAWLAVVGKSLIMWSFVEYFRAMHAFRTGGHGRRGHLAAVPAVAVASTLFLLLRPGVPMSTGLLSACCAVYAALAVREALLESRRAGTHHGVLVAIGLGGSATMLALRAALLALPETWAAHAWVTRPGPGSAVLAVIMLAPTVATLGFVLMGSDRLLAQVRRTASTDALTGLLNRGAFVAQAQRVLERCKARGEACTLLMVDLDRFKSVNDRFGHETGDRALEQVSAALAGEVRVEDLIGRVGGEEFVVLLPGMHAGAGQGIAERIRLAIKGEPLLVNGMPLPLSVSVGVSELRDSSDDLSVMMRRADQAMYAAKSDGRDRVKLHLA